MNTMKSRRTMLRTLLCTALLCATAGTALAGTGPESDPNSLYWDDQFPIHGLNGSIRAMVKDGAGNLYIGGTFTSVVDVAANRVAKWTAATASWSALGAGVDGNVFALAMDASGNVYAGGDFTLAGGGAAANVAKWDGAAWSALGTGTNGVVTALAVNGSGPVYAGGLFPMAGGTMVNFVAEWDGAAWSALGAGVWGDTSRVVYALAVDGSGNVYAGGDFTTAGGGAAQYVAQWNGTAWSALGTGMNGAVYTLLLDGSGNVYAGGDFTTAGGGSANRVAKWNGSAWSTLGAGMIGSVRCLSLDGSGNIHAGGSFTLAGGIAANAVAQWNGTKWSALGTGTDGTVYALATDGTGHLCAGGQFTTAGGEKAIAFATWNGTAWNGYGSGLDNTVNVIAADGSGNVYAGGFFTTTDSGDAAFVARWNGAAWAPLGVGMSNGDVRALAVDGSGNLYAGGSFLFAGNSASNHIGKWNGSAWMEMANGLGGVVEALAVDGAGNVYAGGSFDHAVGGVAADNVAKWNGTAWSALGAGLGSTVKSLAVDGSGNVYAGGYFTTAGGVTANHVAKWNGSVWSALGTGTNDTVYAVAADGAGNVYAGGSFTTAGGGAANYAAKWNGTAWSALGAGTASQILALALDGLGDVYAGGGSGSGGYTAKWNGTAWSSLGTGMNNEVCALAVKRNTLFAGGAFGQAGGKVSGYFGVWQPRVNQSQATLTLSPGAVTIGNDIFGFYKPALTTVAGTTVSYLGVMPVPVTLDRADEIQMGGIRLNGALTLGPADVRFGGKGASLCVEFSEDDAAAYGVAYDRFRAAALTYPPDYPANKEAASYKSLGAVKPVPVRVENGRQIYAVTVSLTATGSTYAAAPKSFLPPDAPTNPGATDIGTDTLTWTWTDNSDDETGFTLWAGPGTGAPVTLLTTTAADATSYPWSGLSVNTPYTFQVAGTNARGDSDKTTAFSAWTLANAPVAPGVDGAGGNTLNVTIGSGDGNPPNTEYAIRCTTTGQWVRANGTLGTAQVWQTAADWATKTVVGLEQLSGYAFSVTARNGAGVNTAAGPEASGTTLDALPTAEIYLLTSSPTTSDTVAFAVHFSEPVGTSFNDSTLRVTGTLAGTAVVTVADDPYYTVAVTLADPNADGACGIDIEDGLVTDLTGNFCTGGHSSLCTIHNWPGFALQPQDAKLYVGDTPELRVQVDEGGTFTTYQWMFDNGSTVANGANDAAWPFTILDVGAAGAYWCEVRFDGAPHISGVAHIQVQPRVRIVLPPVEGSATEGNDFAFTVTAAGGYGPLSYQWKKGGENITGANSGKYTLSHLALVNSGNYSVEVSDTNGDSIESVPVALTVSPRVPTVGLGGLALLVVALAAAARKKRR